MPIKLIAHLVNFGYPPLEHVDHVVNMIKSLEVEYIFQSGYKKTNFTNVVDRI